MKGIVIACPKVYELICLENIILLRTTYNCNLPIEIWEIGNEITEITKNKMGLFNVIFKNVNDYSSKPSHWKGFQVKAIALYNSCFDEAILCDADVTFYNNPEIIFSDVNYIRTGTYFFRDLDQWVFHNLTHDTQDKFRSIDFFTKRKMFIRNLIPNKTDKFPIEFAYIYENDMPKDPVKEALQESGVVYINKTIHTQTLDYILKLNDNHNETYKYLWGDKETFWLGCVMANKDYYFNETAGFNNYNHSTDTYNLTHSYKNQFFWKQK
jgi:hypothetical protein